MARIVFAKELSLEVEEDLEEARRRLQTDEWPEFSVSTRGGTVFVHAAQVAYVQETPSREMHAF